MDEATRVKTVKGSGPEANIIASRNWYYLCDSTLLREYVPRKFLNDPWRQPGAVVHEDELPNVGVKKLHDLDVETSMHESAEARHCRSNFFATLFCVRGFVASL